MAAMPTVTVPVKFVFADGLVVGPDEVLVIRLPSNISEQEFYEARERITAALPEQIHRRVMLVAAEGLGKVTP